jgi:hypothetical protein
MSEEQNQENPVPENTIVDNGTQVSVAAPQAEGEIAADACVSNTVDSPQQALASEVTPPADNTAKIYSGGVVHLSQVKVVTQTAALAGPATGLL